MPDISIKKLLLQGKKITEIADIFNLNPAFVEIRIKNLAPQIQTMRLNEGPWH